ncbi:hypothetical protein FRC04_005663 [Tulasnella sp. 424]|nr:hypothetical protein FRC04_005663 [Tulasnella sp. 424]KAG8962132.1 hypothetical protein FRC05_005506 [Tulasnella sp. 425]
MDVVIRKRAECYERSRPNSSRTTRPAAGRRGDSENDAMQVDSVYANSPTPVNEPEVQMTDAASSLQGPAAPWRRFPQTDRPSRSCRARPSWRYISPLSCCSTPCDTHPFRPDSVNPYLTTICTFLATIFRNEITLQIVEKFVPRNEFTLFFTQIYQKTSSSRSGSGASRLDNEGSKTSKWFGSSPLLEDWCLRGTEWNGFVLVKSEAGITSEMNILIPPVALIQIVRENPKSTFLNFEI